MVYHESSRAIKPSASCSFFELVTRFRKIFTECFKIARVFQNSDFGSNSTVPLEFGAPT